MIFLLIITFIIDITYIVDIFKYLMKKMIGWKCLELLSKYLLSY